METFPISNVAASGPSGTISMFLSGPVDIGSLLDTSDVKGVNAKVMSSEQEVVTIASHWGTRRRRDQRDLERKICMDRATRKGLCPRYRGLANQGTVTKRKLAVSTLLSFLPASKLLPAGSL